jgi:signal transduction histidine kinase
MHAPASVDSVPLPDETALADLGELAGPLSHEVNDLLNSLTLHLAVLQQTGTQEMAGELQQVRRQITRVATLVARFQRLRRRHAREPVLLDINTLLRQAVHDVHSMPPTGTGVFAGGQPTVSGEAEVAIQLDLAEDLPKVRAQPADMRRLLRFLLANAVRAVAPGGPPVLVRTSQSPDGRRVQIMVEDAGPDIAHDQLPKIFEPGNEQREGMCCFELAACRSLIRHLQGTLEASPRPEKGLHLTVTVPGET